MCVCVCVCVYVCVCIYILINLHIYIYIYIYITCLEDSGEKAIFKFVLSLVFKKEPRLYVYVSSCL